MQAGTTPFTVNPGDLGTRVRLLDGTLRVHDGVDITCGRPVDQKHVKKLARTWDANFPQVIRLIADKDGMTYWVLDGQHRCSIPDLLDEPMTFHAMIIPAGEYNVDQVIRQLFVTNANRSTNLNHLLAQNKLRSSWPEAADAVGLNPLYRNARFKLTWPVLIKAVLGAQSSRKRHAAGDSHAFHRQGRGCAVTNAWIVPPDGLQRDLQAAAWWHHRVALPAAAMKLRAPMSTYGMTFGILLYTENMPDLAKLIEEAPPRLLSWPVLPTIYGGGNSMLEAETLMFGYLKGINRGRQTRRVTVLGNT